MFGEKMKKARLKRGYTQEYMAEKLGVNKGTVSHYEKGKTFPNEEKLVRVSKILNVSFDYLLGEQRDIDEIPESRSGTTVLKTPLVDKSTQEEKSDSKELPDININKEALSIVDEAIKKMLDIRKDFN
jgi:transcriptional regulator with XRE-family HTH domain